MAIELTKTFTDGEIMDAWIRSYLREYAPAGYDTRIEIEMEQTYKEWQEDKIRFIIKVNRLESCD